MANDKADGYEAYVRDYNNTLHLMLRVDGVHCAGCIQKIESRLSEDEDVTNVRLNFTTGALQIAWHGDVVKANSYVDKISALGYRVMPYVIGDKQAEDENKFLLLCLGVAGFASGNIMLLSFGLWITTAETMGGTVRDFFHLICGLIAIPAIIFSGRPFYRSAIEGLKNGRTNMDVPISLALILTTVMSVHETWRSAEHVYFDSAVMLMFFLLIGRYLDFKARANARSAATDLMSTLQGFATVVDGQKTRRLPIKDIKADMIVQVAMGEKFPVDGVIIEGETAIDTSLVTGETVPRTAVNGDEVYAGTVNLDGAVKVKVSKAADDSLLADVVRLMDQAGQSQAAYTRLADRAAKLYTPVVHTFAAVAFILWFFILGIAWQDALMIAVTVLIITCPCALGLAVPVAQVLATGRLMKDKILVKSGDALERLAAIDTVFMDKTGTLTLGKAELHGDYDAGDLQIAASIASLSKHPLSVALTNAYDGELLPVDKLKEHAGKGLEGVIDGTKIRIGSRKWCGDNKAAAYSGPEIWLKIGRQKPVQFRFIDRLRNDAADVINIMTAQGLKTAILSGDRQDVVDTIAGQAGVTEAYGELTPPEKFTFLQREKGKGHHILMVGDGLNDAPVLAGADVSMAPGTAIDMAQNAADIVFMGDDFNAVGKAYRLAVRTQRIIRENFWIATIYNVIAIPLAFMGYVTPMIAALAMSGSSIIVILNSFRLRWRV